MKSIPKPALLPIIGVAIVMFVVGLGACQERGVGHKFNKTVGPRKVASVVLDAGPFNVGVCRCRPDRQVTISWARGMHTVGFVYDADSHSNGSGILLIHGDTWLGQRLSTYRIFARKLAERGYTVLTYDEPGYGLSHDPFEADPKRVLKNLDRVAAAQAAVDYLVDSLDVLSDQVSVIGHSRGASAALMVERTKDDIQSVTLIGPTRRVTGNEEALAGYLGRRFRDTNEFVYERPIPDWFDVDLIDSGLPFALSDLALETYLPIYSSSDHTPIMLMDGERENRADREYLSNYFEKLSAPKRFVRLRNSDHYSNTAQSLGLIFYDRNAVSHLVEETVQWLESTQRS